MFDALSRMLVSVREEADAHDAISTEFCVLLQRGLAVMRDEAATLMCDMYAGVLELGSGKGCRASTQFQVYCMFSV